MTKNIDRSATVKAVKSSKIIEFYRGGQGPADLNFQTINQILDWSDYKWEDCHSFIQWIFPNPDPSSYNPNAPILTEQDIKEFKTCPDLQEKLHESFHRFLRFIGLRYDGKKVYDDPKFSEKIAIFRLPNHNWLRITRVLICLRLCGLEKEANALYKKLMQMYESNIGISENTMQYWRKALS